MTEAAEKKRYVSGRVWFSCASIYRNMSDSISFVCLSFSFYLWCWKDLSRHEGPLWLTAGAPMTSSSRSMEHASLSPLQGPQQSQKHFDQVSICDLETSLLLLWGATLTGSLSTGFWSRVIRWHLWPTPLDVRANRWTTHTFTFPQCSPLTLLLILDFKSKQKKLQCNNT